MSTTQRRHLISAIHATANSLGMEEETRRALQARISPQHGPTCESCAQMSHPQLSAVLAELHRLAGRNTPSVDVYAGRPKNLADKPLLRKIAALLTTQKKPWAYAHAIGSKLGGGTRLEFCTDAQLRKVVAALEYDRQRHPASSP